MKDKKVVGKFISNERGFGFVEISGEDNDIFIPPNMTNGSMMGDTVMVKIINEEGDGHRAEGKITESLKHEIVVVIGTFQRSKNFGFVIPDDKHLGTDIFIPKASRKKAKNGDKVVVKITKYPKDGKSAEGEITEILGKSSDTNVDLISVVKAHNYKLLFPTEVEKEAKLYYNENDRDYC